MFGAAAPLAVKRRRTRRRRRVLSGCAVVVVVALLVAAIVQSRSTNEVQVQQAPSAPAGEATAAQLADGHWEVIPAAPLAVRDDAASIWTGHELIVWGGVAKATGEADPGILDDGAAYNP